MDESGREKGSPSRTTLPPSLPPTIIILTTTPSVHQSHRYYHYYANTITTATTTTTNIDTNNTTTPASMLPALHHYSPNHCMTTLPSESFNFCLTLFLSAIKTLSTNTNRLAGRKQYSFQVEAIRCLLYLR